MLKFKRRSLAACAISLAITSNSMAQDPQPTGDVLKAGDVQWKYASEFSDEFEGSQVDTKKWNINTEDWGTWSWEPDNTSEADGSMSLQMVQHDHQRGNEKLAYTSGIARSFSTITYGYFEARIKGCSLYPGACPSFWLHSKGPANRYQAKDGETVTYSEIDIVELQQCEFDNETKSRHLVNRIDCNLHTQLLIDGQKHWIRPNSKPEMCKNEYDSPWDPRDDYHIYAVENTPETIVWYIDGKEVGRKPNLYWHLPMHITLSLGLRHPFEAYKNGQRVPALEETTTDGFPTAMLVDYVRVWQNPKYASLQPSTAATIPSKKLVTKKPMNGSATKPASTDWTMQTYIVKEKANWDKNGWNWNESKVESNFKEIDTNEDGVASGIERQIWYTKTKAANN
ncbi:kappa-carrageenase [Rubripirellula reticaptiva]|uniref:Kappa-carrageenase n=1 Tax=Rubripirellula reticaptiva TaxID=2528013 RepID=A0A5C6EPU3_9BACT|nr:kappa-carrageenase [Rubripirellula reticaptiva]TWU51783.1 Kappa-carrageenase precursor [Rubripirellula reticaptiva]